MDGDRLVPLLNGRRSNNWTDDNDDSSRDANANGNNGLQTFSQNRVSPERPARNHHHHHNNADANSSAFDSQEIPHSLLSFGVVPQQQRRQMQYERSLVLVQLLVASLACLFAFFSDSIAIPVFQVAFVACLLVCICLGFGQYIVLEMIHTHYRRTTQQRRDRDRDGGSAIPNAISDLEGVDHDDVQSTDLLLNNNIQIVTSRGVNGSHCNGDDNNYNIGNGISNNRNTNSGGNGFADNSTDNGILPVARNHDGISNGDSADAVGETPSPRPMQSAPPPQTVLVKQVHEMSWAKYFVCFILPVSVVRAVPAKDYLQFNMPTRTAYAITLVIYTLIHTAVVSFAGYFQYMVWKNALVQRQRRLQTAKLPTLTVTVFHRASQSASAANQDLLPSFEYMLLSTLVFPVGLTAIFQLVFEYSPIGGVGNPSMSAGIGVMDPITLQLSSLVGQIGILFWVGWIATCSAAVLLLQILQYLFRTTTKGSSSGTTTAATAAAAAAEETQRVNSQMQVKQRSFVVTMASAALLVHIYGSLRYNQYTDMHPILATFFNANAIQYWRQSNAPILQVSCLLPTVFEADQEPSLVSSMIERTNERLRAGDDLVMWSELAVEDPVDPTAFEWPVTTNPGAVVAVTFADATGTGGSNSFRNSMALFQNGTLIGRYDKNHPVPFIEADVVASSVPPPKLSIDWTPRVTRGGSAYVPDDACIVSSSPEVCASIMQRSPVSLNVTMAICFDFDFANFIRGAAAEDVDLLLGPSEYYSSLGWNILGDNVYRAVENGVTLYKCSNDGITGAVDARGRLLSAKPTIQGETYVSSISITKGVKTMYSNHGGYRFGWLCVVLYPVVMLGCMVWSIRIHRQDLRHGNIQL